MYMGRETWAGGSGTWAGGGDTYRGRETCTWDVRHGQEGVVPGQGAGTRTGGVRHVHGT